MNKRQKLVQQRFLNDEEKVIKRLNTVYSKSLDDVKDKISKLEFDIDKMQVEYDWMDPNDPERAKLKSKIQSKIYQKNYQEQLHKQLDGILNQMQMQQYLTISDYLDGCYTDGFIGTIFDAHGQGVPIVTPIDQESVVRAVQLDSKISKGLYTRLGENVDLLKRKIVAQVSRGISTGMSYAQVAKGLTDYTRIGYNNAVRIARTEGHRIQTTAAMDAMEVAKDKGADVVKQWDATLDGRTRESHSQVDGEIRELDKPFSNGLKYPGDPSGGAAEVVNCRCAILQRARWALDDDELQTLKDRAAYFGLDKSTEFEEFKKKYLKAVETPEKTIYSADVFPEAFRKTKYGKNASQIFADTLSDADGLDPDIAKLYTHIGDLPNMPNGYAVSYTAKDHALGIRYDWLTGDITDCKLSIPKMEGLDLNGQKGVAFHEMGHLIDLGSGQGRKAMTKTHQKLTDTVKKVGESMSDEVKDLFDDFEAQIKTSASDISKKYSKIRSKLSGDYQTSRMTWKEYKKAWDATYREQEAEVDYTLRNLFGGGVNNLSDIYDALSAGRYQDSRKLSFGHGASYFRSEEHQNSEIFANYMSLSVTRPDLIEVLRRDKPELCEVLDEIIKEMAGKIK